jgi:hypothetical protein
MSARRRRGIGGTALALALAVGAAGRGLAAAPARSTQSFSTDGGRGSFPGGLVIRDREITVDLARLGEEARVTRAILRIRRDPPVNSGDRPAPETIEIAPGDRPDERLPLRPPRFLDFDATGPASRALAAGRPLALRSRDSAHSTGTARRFSHGGSPIRSSKRIG